jgi:hypothetical protein
MMLAMTDPRQRLCSTTAVLLGLMAWAAALGACFWTTFLAPKLHVPQGWELMVRAWGTGLLWLAAVLGAQALWPKHASRLWWVWASILPLLWPLWIFLRWTLAPAAPGF